MVKSPAAPDMEGKEVYFNRYAVDNLIPDGNNNYIFISDKEVKGYMNA